MLLLRPIGRDQAGYYVRGPGPGSWLGSGCASLGLEGPVGRESISAVLAGRAADGSPLLARIPPNRRAGFDLVFASPKSVSLLAGLAPAASRASIGLAHEAAIRDAVDYLEAWALRTRRGARDRRIGTEGFIAAAFPHRSNWSGEPHLHTHVVVANLVLGDDGRWGCLDRLLLGRHARAAGALYQAALRHHLAKAGFRLAWMVRSDGLADVAGVPRAAIDACSSRRRHVLADAAATGMTTPQGRVAVAGRTRRTHAAPADQWVTRAAEAGFDRDKAARLLAGVSGQVTSSGPRDPEALLAVRTPAFTRPDVVAAVAATSEPGTSVAALAVEVDRFLLSAIRVGSATWSTRRLQALASATVDAASQRGQAAGVAPRNVVEAAIAAHPELRDEGQAAVGQLTTTGTGLAVIAAASFVDQAAVVEAAGAAWQAAGHRVAVVTGSDRAQQRWRALTGLSPPPPLPRQASVLVVDGADHLGTVALHRLVTDTLARGGKLVLIQGGTLPARRQPASPAFPALVDRLGTLRPDVRAGPAFGPMVETVVAGRDGSVVVAPTAADAAGRLVADWHAASQRGIQATMVALGPDEAEHLNQLARVRLTRAGQLAGPALSVGTRQFQSGDTVRLIRPHPRLGVAAGRTGVLTEVDPLKGEITIRWSDRTTVVSVAALDRRSLAHGYATTPPFIRPGHDGQVFALGDGVGRGGVVYLVGPEPIVRRPGLDPVEQLVAGLDRPARAWPRPASRSLAELLYERDRLGARLLAGAPADAGVELRRVQEDSRWLVAIPTAQAGIRLAELGREREALGRIQQHRASWLEANRGQLERWATLDAAVAWRTTALARAAEVAPGRAVTDRIGPPPADERSREPWRSAAGAIEAYRDRWDLPDEPLPGSAWPDPSWDRARQAEQLRMVSACRAVDRGVAVERAVGKDVTIAR